LLVELKAPRVDRGVSASGEVAAGDSDTAARGRVVVRATTGDSETEPRERGDERTAAGDSATLFRVRTAAVRAIFPKGRDPPSPEKEGARWLQAIEQKALQKAEMPPWRGAVSRCTLIVALLCHFGIAGSSSEGCPGAFRDGIATWQAAQLLKCPTLRGRSGLPGGMRTGSEWSIASLKLRGGGEDFATEEGSVGIQPEGSTWTFTDPTAAGLDVKQHADTRAQDESEDWTFQIPTPLHWDRRILVTGGCGFMGSALVDRLVLRYPTYLVVALDVLDECATLFNLETVIKRPNFFFVQADVSSCSCPRSTRCVRSVQRRFPRAFFPAGFPVD